MHDAGRLRLIHMQKDKLAKKESTPRRGQSTVSAEFDDGRIVELLYDPKNKRTSFAVWNGDGWRIENEVTAPGGVTLVPYSPHNNLIQNRVVLLPSRPEEYGGTPELFDQVRRYIHRYVDVPPRFERLACLYVLLTWVYDGFNELPYLRLRGDFGSGKTRFLLTVGALCYKPIFASGASTISPIFHTLDAFRGTLILDEGDFRFTDAKADIVKILNNGNMRGLPVLRTEVSREREFNPRAFHVFGPKIIATRGSYDDRALESRFLTEDMRGGRLREDIPISLSFDYHDEALALRNGLLLYRFRNRATLVAVPLDDPSIEPRLRQIFAPLLAIADPPLREELHWLAREYSDGLATDRAMAMEAEVLAVIQNLLEENGKKALPIKEIAAAFVALYNDEYGHVSAKSIGVIVRQRLGLITRKSQGNFVIPPSELPKLAALYRRYGITYTADSVAEVEVDGGDMGDLGDFLGESEALIKAGENPT